jgi:tetraacyldisaccharide 4'-kinase
LYGEIITIRNKLYDKGVLKSTSFNIPTIVVGNLSVGGTGKSPQIEYLIRLLQNDYKVAVLSRGYKRQSKGFIIANESATVKQIGDEPMQFYQKFKNIIVAVDADRVNGINQLKILPNKPDIILLDDAYQHRKVEAGFNILLTPYDNLYVDDTMLPSGDLREKVTGANRAQLIIVTKCPEHLNEDEQFKIAERLQPEMHQTVFFSKIAYAETIKGLKKIKVDELHAYKVLLVTGIAKTNHLCEFLDVKKIDFQHLKFSDHHHFTDNDLAKIQNTFNQIKSDKKLILTTEKDYVRAFDSTNENVYFLPIETTFVEHQNDFDTLIKNYVEQSSRNN